MRRIAAASLRAAARRAVRRTVAAAALALLCPWAAAGDDQAELDALRVEIVDLIGPAICSNLVHCRALALGWRPCGGPAEYLPYSNFSSNRELLEAKAFEYTLLHEEILRKRQAMGSCEILATPRLQCVDRHCRIEGAP
jgi:hypothetical protein